VPAAPPVQEDNRAARQRLWSLRGVVSDEGQIGAWRRHHLIYDERGADLRWFSVVPSTSGESEAHWAAKYR